MIKQTGLALVIAYVLMAGTATAAPAAKKTFPAPAKSASPHDIVAWLYAPYLADPHATDAVDTGSAIDRVHRFADAALRQGIDRDNSCMRRSQGICNLDFDVVINGQDWDLSDLRISDDAPAGDRQTVHARFSNDHIPMDVAFSFVRVAGQWRIHNLDDIQHEPGKPVEHIDLLKLLNQP